MKQLLCDFCADPNPTYYYTTKDFQSRVLRTKKAAIIVDSRGAWVACDRCHEYIESDDWPGLVKHANDMLTKHIHEKYDTFSITPSLEGTQDFTNNLLNNLFFLFRYNCVGKAKRLDKNISDMLVRMRGRNE
jgi:hypothetical protein